VKKYLGTVVPTRTLFRHAEFGGVFRRSFVLRAAGVRCRWNCRPISHQRTQHGQFERTLIIADKGAYVSTSRLHRALGARNQLHAVVDVGALSAMISVRSNCPVLRSLMRK